MKTLEDAFVKIGLEDEKLHLNYIRKSEIRSVKESIGIVYNENDEKENQEEDEDFTNLPVIEEFN